MSARRSPDRFARSAGPAASGDEPRPAGRARNRRPRRTAAAGALALLAVATGCQPDPSPWRSTAIARGMPCCESPSWVPRFSADGSTLVFMSIDATLVAGDTNGASDVFARDLATGDTTLVSVDAAGTGSGDTNSHLIDISDDGTKVLFATRSADIVAGDTNGVDDLFVRDIAAGTTTAVALDLTGAPAGAWNGDMSADGTVVAFGSDSSALVPGVDDGGPIGGGDVYVRDLAAGTTRLVSVTAAGKASNDAEGIHISADGTRVTFSSMAATYGPTDTNRRDDVYLRDLTAGTTTLVSANAAGTDAANNDSSLSRISPDGRFVAFDSGATDLGPVVSPGWRTYVRDLTTGGVVVLERPGGGDYSSDQPSFSPDSTRVVFRATYDEDPNVPGPLRADIYVRDLVTGETTLVSVDAEGGPADKDSYEPAFDTTGTRVVFGSLATDLVTPSGRDGEAYVRDLEAGTTALASGGADGTGERSDVFAPAMGPGLDVAYLTRATNAADVNLAALRGADLTSTLTAAPSPVPSGGQATLTLTAANAGPDAAEALTAGVLVPAGATIVEASGPAACTTQPIDGATIASCDLGDLAAGAGAEVTVTIEVDAPAGSTLDISGALISPTHDAAPGGRLTSTALDVS